MCRGKNLQKLESCILCMLPRTEEVDMLDCNSCPVDVLVSNPIAVGYTCLHDIAIMCLPCSFLNTVTTNASSWIPLKRNYAMILVTILVLGTVGAMQYPRQI
jgi:hypothetical protein